MRYALVIVIALAAGCVVAIPHGRVQLVCDRSIDERPPHLHCDRRYPLTVTWKFK